MTGLNTATLACRSVIRWERRQATAVGRIEKIVRNANLRELDLIIRLGSVPRAMVGGLAYLVSIALR